MLRENKAEREQMEMVCIEEMVPKDRIPARSNAIAAAAVPTILELTRSIRKLSII